MHSVVRNVLASVPRTSVRPCRTISHRRFPHPGRNFHQTPHPKGPEGGNNKSDGAITDGGDARYDSDGVPAEETVPGEDSSTALSLPPVKDLAHYGSAARRSKRSKSHQEVRPTVRIPEWFLKDNVRIADDLRGSRIALRRWDEKGGKYVDPTVSPRSIPDEPSAIKSGGEAESQATPETANRPPERLYFVDSFQWDELVSTARGLLRPTTQFVADDLASRKNHLILHYAGEGGDYLLDELIQRLAVELRADTVVLDALDITDLACDPHNSGLSEDVADDRRLLSYTVYQKEEGHPTEPVREEEPSNESNEHREENNLGGSRAGMPTIFLDVRGTPLDSASNDFPRGRRSHGQGAAPGPLLSNLGSFFSGKINQDLEQVKAAEQRLKPMIDAVLAGPFLKRSMSKDVGSDAKSQALSPTLPSRDAESPLIIEIRDVKVLQETSFGRKFLNAMYEQIQSRKRRGQRVLIIGTDTFPKVEQYSAENLRSLQSEPPANLSRTMVITPVVPSKEAGLILNTDKLKRIRAINMRHLWQMLCIKVAGLYENRRLRQEWAALTKQVGSKASSLLGGLGAASQLWTFDEVHRLATMVEGHMESDAAKPMQECLSLACKNLVDSDNARFAWSEQQKASRTKSKPGIDRIVSQRMERIRKKLSRHEKKLVGGVIEPHRIATTFNHVHAPVETIDALKTLTTLSLVRPDAFKYGVLASDKIPGLLLYGPPGTGKTLLAKAVAKQSGATVLEVSGADLNDMYVGEGEKNVKALFSLAKKLTPCVVFIDEADAVFSARGGGPRRVSHREMLNQFLREWDGMNNDAGSAFIMVATNRPFDLDDAVLRRLPRRLLVDLPSENDRLEILKIHLRGERLAEDVNLPNIAARTPFYSGSDLKNLSVAAALNCVREENEAAKKHSGKGSFEHAEKRTLTVAHFDRALEDISASVSEDMNSLKQIKKFDEQFGDQRGRKKKSPKWGFRTAAEADKALDTVKVRN